MKIREGFDKYCDRLILIIYSMISIPVFYGNISGGLDASWEYLYNKINLNKIIFGRDLNFTYGPLGFLAYPINLDNRFYFTVFYYSVIYFSQIWLFHRLISKTENKYLKYVSLLLMILVSPNVTIDIFSTYIFMLALAVIWKDSKCYFAYIFAALVCVINFYIKFSFGVGSVMCLALFVILSLLFNKNGKALWLLISYPLLFVCYMIYNPHIEDFFRYINNSKSISRGYVIGQSIGTADDYIIWAVLLIGLYLCIWFVFLINGQYENMSVLMWISPTLFMEYKHGVTGMGMGVSFSAFIIIAALVLLILKPDVSKIRFFYRPFVLACTGISLICGICYYPIIRYIGLPYKTLYELPETINNSKRSRVEEKYTSFEGLPDSFVKEIGGSSFSAYTHRISNIEQCKEIDFAEQYKPFPTVQKYAAETPDLDRFCAMHYTGKDAPEYIIFDFDALFDRLPLFELPETWRTIKNNYDYAVYDENAELYLLKKKSNVRIMTEAGAGTENFDKFSEIKTKGHDKIELKIKLNKKGQAAYLLWRVPEMYMNVNYTDGTEKAGRIMFENFENGIDVKGEPYDKDTLMDSLKNEGEASEIESISFYGPGLRFVQDNIEVEYIDYN